MFLGTRSTMCGHLISAPCTNFQRGDIKLEGPVLCLAIPYKMCAVRVKKRSINSPLINPLTHDRNKTSIAFYKYNDSSR